ncbi:hydantoinase B/oxoprolinase family protein [Conexibacter arvalis]|uniref:N-methylhydantoinase B n=1 Tax=Conexibacter arvalis TaxID=912552 RepID=A0A840IB13_9ACTN|nr:hydantoinase B/oxoprolinase family protein [Conexibacter arvalis]MBB4662107.1 N-methylhydantoinase B [Conexibacter arvalis]
MTSMPETAARPQALRLAVLSNRLDAICREMTNTLQKSGRSAVLSMGRDFSVAIVTAGHELLAAAESLPVHVLGIELQARAMGELHPDLASGDAFLHNDPYLGNSHHADHTILVPVFWEGRHVFTVCAKAHQADAGNAVPTTYFPQARDVYEEGALSFPCVRIQRERRDVDDIVRMCRRRIRVPEQWYGDYLATLGAARIGERRLLELLERFGGEEVTGFAEQWFDYSEARMRNAVARLPRRSLSATTRLDPYPGLPDGIELSAAIAIEPEEGTVTVDLRDNPDCVPAGLNLTEATSIAAAAAGVYNSLDPDIPHNSGSARRIRVLLRRGAVVGIPEHPTSCSMATTHVADRLVNMIQSSLSRLGEGHGLAQGGLGMPPSIGVISGRDGRGGGAPYVNQVMLGATGGPAGPQADGWVNYVLPVVAGLQYRDSVEIDEQKYPLRVDEQRLLADSEGAGRRRGAPGARLVYGPVADPMTVVYSLDGRVNRPEGVRGGGPGGASAVEVRRAGGGPEPIEPVGRVTLDPGDRIVAISCGGGGYGDPREREPARVLHDVREGWVTPARARAVYGVAVAERDGELVLDARETELLRQGPPGAEAANTDERKRR